MRDNLSIQRISPRGAENARNLRNTFVFMLLPSLHFGTSGWKYDDWVGTFFPEPRRGKPVDELAWYAAHFDTVEIDSTWYRTPARHVVESWRRRVPNGFFFAAKVPRLITHDRALIDCAADLKEFLLSISCLEDKLGPLLFQFPPFWNAHEGAAALRAFLPLLPRELKFAMEFRHDSWFQDDFAALLQDFGIAWTLAQQSQFPTQIYATAPFTYIRWLGNRHEKLEPLNSLKKERGAEEQRWEEIISQLPVEEVWGYFNNHWAGYSPGSASAFKTRFGMPASLPNIAEEKSGQGTLF